MKSFATMMLALVLTAPAGADLVFSDNFEGGDLAGWIVRVEESSVCTRPWPEPTPWCLMSPEPTTCNQGGCWCQTVCSSEPAGACWFSVQFCL